MNSIKGNSKNTNFFVVKVLNKLWLSQLLRLENKQNIFVHFEYFIYLQTLSCDSTKIQYFLIGVF
jgi:hypothetical protein